MKRVFGIILTAVMLLLLVGVGVFSVVGASSPAVVRLTVLSDVHFVTQERFTADNYEGYATEDKMEHLSEAVVRTLADEIAESDTRYLLVSGDLTEDGDRASHEALAGVFRQLESRGVNVFVINGNHDVPTNVSSLGYKIAPKEFSEIYSEFGYNEAVSLCPGTLSYSANIGNDYRLIAVDNISYYYNDIADPKPSLSMAHEMWIKEEIKNAKAEGRRPFLMSHIPFKEHFPKLISAFTGNAAYVTMAKEFADMGANFAFTGHLHINDIQEVKSDSENIFYDVAAPSMIHYPCTYREVNLFPNKVDVTTAEIDYVNEEYLSEYSPIAEREALKKGLQSYCVDHLRQALSTVVSGLDSPSGLLGSLLSGTGDSAEVMQIVATVAKESLYAPLYIEDEDGDTDSIERVMDSYGVDIPKVDYLNVVDISPVYAACVFRDEGKLKDKDTTEIIEPFLYYVLHRLNEVSPEIEDITGVSLNIDVAHLIETGDLECYDSGIVPLVTALLEDEGGVIDMVLPIIKSDFSGVASLQPIIDGLFDGALVGITDYIGTKEIRLHDLIFEGLFLSYAPEVYERAIPGEELTIEYA